MQAQAVRWAYRIILNMRERSGEVEETMEMSEIFKYMKMTERVQVGVTHVSISMHVGAIHACRCSIQIKNTKMEIYSLSEEIAMT